MSICPKAMFAALILASSAPLLAEPLSGADELQISAVNDQAVLKTAAAQKSYALLGRPSRLQQLLLQQNGGEPAMPAPLAQAIVSTGAEPASIVRATEYASSDRPDVFGSIALPVTHAPLDRQWQRAKRGGVARGGAWNGLLNRVRSQGPREQIEAVNQWVNARIAFGEDRQLHGEGDRWSGVAESVRRGRGDCEDYAIAKMQLLRAVGFAEKDLYLTIVKDLVRGADHAVLVIRSEGEFLVLDNGTNRILASGEVADYRPIFTYAANQTWVHGYRAPVRIAALTPGNDTVGTH